MVWLTQKIFRKDNNRRIAYRIGLSSTLAALILLSAPPASAARPRPARGQDAAAEKSDTPAGESPYARLGQAKSLFYAGKPEESLTLLDDLAAADQPQVRLQARFLAARCLWLSDNEKARVRPVIPRDRDDGPLLP